MVDVIRDPRWGRVVEGVGGRPFLWVRQGLREGQCATMAATFSVADKICLRRQSLSCLHSPIQSALEYSTTDMS